jgi:hypothetical protein
MFKSPLPAREALHYRGIFSLGNSSLVLPISGKQVRSENFGIWNWIKILDHP